MLEFLRTGPADAGDGDPVLILLHGRGSDMGDLQGLASVLPPRGTLVTPQAPHSGWPWGYGPGWAWYRYLGQGRVDRVPMDQSLEALENFMEGLSEILGFRPGPLVLGGFSQGGTTSLAYALTHPGTVAGVVNLSGFLVNRESFPEPLDPLRDTPLFWAHGTEDPAVPFPLAVEGRRRLRQADIPVESWDYPIGHWVSPQEMEDLKKWLEASIGDWIG